jgi:hypothetical protein
MPAALWRAYAEKVVEIAGHVARAEERKRLKLAALKGVHAGLLRLCRQNDLKPQEVAGPRLLGSERMAALDRSPEVEPGGEAVRETHRVLATDWDRREAEAHRRAA